MKLTYDFHIHTALSPCADEMMTPNNIVNMALLNKLDMIAITDHNTCGNVEAVMAVGKKSGLSVIPGMEIETKEEIHVVCLFPELENALHMQEVVWKHLPNINNKASIFGEQSLLDADDDVIGTVDRLLVQATSLSIDELLKQVQSHSGILIPAHIDRPSYSIISNLGMIPSNLFLPNLEISRHVDYEKYKEQYKNYRIIQSSDAHDLGYIGICNRQIEVSEKSIENVLEKLSSLPHKK